MQLVAGFWSFKSLAVAVELELFTALRDGRSVTVDEARQEFGLAERGADMLLAACASLGLLDKQGDRYRNSPLAERFLVTGREDYFGGQIRYCDQRTYLPWHRIGEALRTDQPLTWDPAEQTSMFKTEDPVMLSLFWEAMHSTSTYTARALAGAYDFGRHERLLDVGGGSAAYPIVLCQQYAALSATVYDLPPVCGSASRRIASIDLADRISVEPGDFLRDDAFPRGHDVILLSMILHDWDARTNRMLLQKCSDALVPGGSILVCELFLNDDRSGPELAALMGMNMLVETTGGRNYSEMEYESWLTEAGFMNVRMIRFESPGANGVMVATKA